jgi:hypothetical protein
MIMLPRLRKFMLTVHITSSVGWIGAVIAYLGLVFAAWNSADVQTVRAAWFAMELTGWGVIVPLSLASLVTGLVQSLGTKWGLFRHYWVLISLLLTLVATVVLIQHMPTVSCYAGVASAAETASRAGLQGEFIHAGGGLLILLVIQTLNVFKPQGLTPYGWRKQQSMRTNVAYEELLC